MLAYVYRHIEARKLHIRRPGSYHVLKVLSDNSSQLNLPLRSRLSPTFNTADLIRYEGPVSPPVFIIDTAWCAPNLQTLHKPSLMQP